MSVTPGTAAAASINWSTWYNQPGLADATLTATVADSIGASTVSGVAAITSSGMTAAQIVTELGIALSSAGSTNHTVTRVGDVITVATVGTGYAQTARLQLVWSFGTPNFDSGTLRGKSEIAVVDPAASKVVAVRDALAQTVAATFGGDASALGITGSTFTLSDGSSSVAGTVATNGTTATFTPTAALEYGTTYTATIAAPLVDGTSWSFSVDQTARKKVIDSIGTKLATIGATTVFRGLKDWDSVGVSEMPWIGYWPGVETSETVSSVSRRTLPVHVLVHTASVTQAAKTDDLAEWQEKVMVALTADQSLGGVAVMVTPVECETDEGDEETVDSRGGSGTMMLTFDVVYYRCGG